MVNETSQDEKSIPNIKVDIEFRDKLEHGCMGSDLYKRCQGLITILNNLQAEEFRKRRLAYVIHKLLVEPENTNHTVVPILFKQLRGVQEFVDLSKSLTPLWDKCCISNLSSSLVPSFIPLAQNTLEKVCFDL